MNVRFFDGCAYDVPDFTVISAFSKSNSKVNGNFLHVGTGVLVWFSPESENRHVSLHLPELVRMLVMFVLGKVQDPTA